MTQRSQLVLHTCCAPCLLMPLEHMASAGYDLIPYYYNPNIHPEAEWRKRRDTLLSYAAKNGLRVAVEEEYAPGDYLCEAQLNPRRPDRCSVCYRVRLLKTAEYAKNHGASCFSTTLCVSPYQDHEAIRQAGETAARIHGVEFLYRDFRPDFRRGQNLARELGLYRQRYCGCMWSELERNEKPSGR